MKQLICLLLFLVIPKVFCYAEDYTVNFDKDSLVFTREKGGDGNEYMHIDMKGLYKKEEPAGAPTLPVKYVRIPLPDDAINIALHACPNKVISNTIDLRIYPAQEPIPTSEDGENSEFTKCDEAIYSKSGSYPENHAAIAWSENQAAIIAVYPIKYYPTENRYEFAEEITLSLSYVTNNQNKDQMIFFPEGTKWTELRLDTTKYDSWYTEVEENGEIVYVPNFERLDFTVGKLNTFPQSAEHYFTTYREVHCSTSSRKDSLCYYVGQDGDSTVYACLADETLDPNTNENYRPWLFRPWVYEFDEWEEGKTLTHSTCHKMHTTSSVKWIDYGTIMEINEGTFGGDKPLKYATLEDGTQIIWGIGVPRWNGHDCLFGPAEIYEELLFSVPERFEDSEYLEYYRERFEHHRSILVYFERDGEVLYDLWPDKDGNLVQSAPTLKAPLETDAPIYDLQGRRIQTAPERGIYIRGGKKYVNSR